MKEKQHCVKTVHAEENSVAQAAMNGTNINYAILYLTSNTYLSCFKIIANCGIKKIYFGEFYKDERIFEFAEKTGIELIDMSQF